MSGYGIPQTQISMVLGIGEATLRKRYPDELARAGAMRNAKVAESLFAMACGAPAEYEKTADGKPVPNGRKVREEQQRVVAAAIFWMKTRAGWQEVSRHEHSGPADKNAPPIPVHISSLSDGQLDEFIDRLGSRIGPGAAGPAPGSVPGGAR